MELQNLVDALSNFGVGGLVAALVILLGVFVARKSGLVATGNQARLANIILSAVLYGLNGSPDAGDALNGVLSSLIAALAFEGLGYLRGLPLKG